MSKQKTFINFLVISCIYGIFTALWIVCVKPVPDIDSEYQFFTPALNYFKLYLHDSQNPMVLLSCFPPEYPLALPVLTMLSALAGLSTLFLTYPWLFTIYLVAPLALCLGSTSFKSLSLWKAILFFLFPFACLSIRSLSPAGFSSIWLFCGILLYLDYQKNKHPALLVCSGFLLCAAIGTKHIGAMQFLIFASAVILYRIKHKFPLKLEVAFLFLCFFFGTMFYDSEELINYIIATFKHNTGLYPSHGIILAFLALSTFVFLIHKITRINLKTFRVFPWGNVWIFSSILMLILAVPLILPCVNSAKILIIHTLVAISIVSTFFVIYVSSEEQSLLSFICVLEICLGYILFASGVGMVFNVFFLPGMLCSFLFLINVKTKPHLWGASVLFVIISNFFPSLRWLEDNLGEHFTYYYEMGFNNIHVNLLGWEPCRMGQIFSGFKSLLESNPIHCESDLDYPILYMNMHSFTFDYLNMANKLLTDCPTPIPFHPQESHNPMIAEMIHTLEEAYTQSGNDGIKTLLKQGFIPEIFVLEDPFIDAGNDISKDTLHLHDYSDTTAYTFLRLHQLITIDALLLHGYFRAIPLNINKSPAGILYIHKSIPKQTCDSEFKEQRYREYYNECLSNSDEEIPPHRDKGALSSRLVDENLFLKSAILLGCVMVSNEGDDSTIEESKLIEESLFDYEKTLLANTNLCATSEILLDNPYVTVPELSGYINWNVVSAESIYQVCDQVGPYNDVEGAVHKSRALYLDPELITSHPLCEHLELPEAVSKSSATKTTSN